MDTLAQFLQTFVTHEREAERQRELNYVQLILAIKSELMRLHEEWPAEDLEEVD